MVVPDKNGTPGDVALTYVLIFTSLIDKYYLLSSSSYYLLL